MKRIRYISGIQQTECGLCCVKMLLDFYKAHIPIIELRKMVNLGRDGTPITILQKILQKYNMDTAIQKVTPEELLSIQGPVIIHWEKKHYVTYEQYKRNKVYLIDPSQGRVKISLDEFRNKFTGYALFAVPGISFLKRKNEYVCWKAFIPIIFKDKQKFLKVTILTVMVYFLTIMLPIIMQYLVDSLTRGIANNLFFFVKCFAGFSVMTAVISYLKSVSLIKLRLNIDMNVTDKVVTDLLEVPYAFFDTRSNTDLIYTMNSCSTFRELFANQVIRGVIDIGAVIFISIYFFTTNVYIGLVIILMFIINIIYVIITNPIAIDYSKSYIMEQSKTHGKYIEMIQSMMGIKMLSIERDIYSQWNKQFQTYQKKFYISEKVSSVIDVISGILQLVSPIIILLISIGLVTKGQMSLGTALALYSLSSTFFGMVTSVFNTYWCFVKADIYMERLGDISLFEKEEVFENRLLKYEAKGKIQLDNVGYAYGLESGNVIKNVSLTIIPGEKIAIVGSSGCGKSTLAKLIIGLYKPNKGVIRYDDIEEDKLDMSYIRKQFGIVPQDVTLFNKSIYDNISMERQNVSMDDVVKVAKIVNIHNEIESMPLKYNTIVSDFGANLSGGQRQRIILARAIINIPKILVLDEATSALDYINESNLSEFLRKRGCTRIVIAHRLSTIVDADKIIVLHDGEVVESGTHEELIKNKNQYYRLYNSNLLEVNKIHTIREQIC